MSVTKIVLTGGPGSGKSMTIEALKAKLCTGEARYELGGRRCLFLSETASELILGGVAPSTCRSVYDFQSILFDLQLEKERAFDEATRRIEADDFILFYDRGLIDGGAYICDEEFGRLLEEKKTSVAKIYGRYDAVFALQTPDEYYSVSNNPARSESPGTAKIVNERTIALWKGHPNMTMIPSAPTFEEKFEVLFKALKAYIDSRTD